MNTPKPDCQLNSLVQNEFQNVISKIDHINSKTTKNTTNQDEENNAMAKLISARLKKIDQSKKNNFKFCCMKILYDD